MSGIVGRFLHIRTADGSLSRLRVAVLASAGSPVAGDWQFLMTHLGEMRAFALADVALCLTDDPQPGDGCPWCEQDDAPEATP